jgi:hypothetical protein
MDDEQLQYPVHGSKVRYAVASMRQQGIPFAMQQSAGGIYIIVIPAGYAPMVQNAPWVHQPSPASVLQQIPIVQIALAVLILVVAWFGFQAAPVVLASLGSGDAAMVEKEKGREGEGESGNPLQAALDAVLVIPDKVTGEIDRRVDEAKQEVEQAMFSAALMSCGVPLLGLLVIVAGALVLRTALRGRR